MKKKNEGEKYGLAPTERTAGEKRRSLVLWLSYLRRGPLAFGSVAFLGTVVCYLACSCPLLAVVGKSGRVLSLSLSGTVGSETADSHSERPGEFLKARGTKITVPHGRLPVTSSLCVDSSDL